MHHALRDALDRRGDRRHRHAHRIVEHLLGKIFDFAGHGGGEEQGLPLGRNLGDDFADIADEAHVEHAVGFVENEDFDVAETQRVALDEIEQAAGCGHQHFDAMHERAHLTSHRNAADGERHADIHVAAIGLEAVDDLPRQFAGRAQHEHAAGLLFGALPVRGDLVKDWQRESRGLSGAGLGDADDIASRHCGRNGLGLDRGRSDIALVGERTRNRQSEAEFSK